MFSKLDKFGQNLDLVFVVTNWCRNLNMDYIDLYLIHWPVSSKAGIYEYPIKKEDFLPMDFKAV